MKTVKKWIAFMLAVGLIVTVVKVTAVTVLADSEIVNYNYNEEKDINFKSNEDWRSYDFSSGGVYVVESDGMKHYFGLYPPATVPEKSAWWNMGVSDFSSFDRYTDAYMYNGMNWSNYYGRRYNGLFGSGIYDDSSISISIDNVVSLTEEEIAAIISQAEAKAVQQGAFDEGFSDVGDMYRAAEKDMSAGEYYNNVVTSTPGIEHTFTVGQGGNLVVNGVVTNMTATITKVTNRAYVDSARISQPEAILLNVVDVSYPAVEATINFYMPSVTAEMDIVAMQYNGGAWVDVDVAEVREDHVVLNMKGNGVIAFFGK